MCLTVNVTYYLPTLSLEDAAQCLHTHSPTTFMSFAAVRTSGLHDCHPALYLSFSAVRRRPIATLSSAYSSSSSPSTAHVTATEYSV